MRKVFWNTLHCNAVATRRIPDVYKPKPNPYLNTNPNPNLTLLTLRLYCVKTPVKTLSCIQENAGVTVGTTKPA